MNVQLTDRSSSPLPVPVLSSSSSSSSLMIASSSQAQQQQQNAESTTSASYQQSQLAPKSQHSTKHRTKSQAVPVCFLIIVCLFFCRPNKKKNKNKVNSDMGSVPAPKSSLYSPVHTGDSPNSATHRKRRQFVAEFGDSRRFR